MIADHPSNCSLEAEQTIVELKISGRHRETWMENDGILALATPLSLIPVANVPNMRCS